MFLQKHADSETLESIMRKLNGERFDLLTSPKYILKRNLKRGNRHGSTVPQEQQHKARTSYRQALKKKGTLRSTTGSGTTKSTAHRSLNYNGEKVLASKKRRSRARRPHVHCHAGRTVHRTLVFHPKQNWKHTSATRQREDYHETTSNFVKREVEPLQAVRS